MGKNSLFIKKIDTRRENTKVNLEIRANSAGEMDDDVIIQQCLSPLGLSPDFKLQQPLEPVYEPVYEPTVFDGGETATGLTVAMIDNGIQMNPDDFDQDKLFFDLFNDEEELNKQKSTVAQKPAKDLHGSVPNTDCPAAQQQYVDQSPGTSSRRSGKDKTSYASYSGSQRQSPYSRPMASDAVQNCQTQLPNPCSEPSQYNDIEFDFEDAFGQSSNIPPMLDNSIHHSIDASDGSILVSEPVVAPPAETVDVNAEVIIQCPHQEPVQHWDAHLVNGARAAWQADQPARAAQKEQARNRKSRRQILQHEGLELYETS